ncbi:MAG: type IV pilus twitching motility protein PilT [Janthinobacterium lividum]
MDIEELLRKTVVSKASDLHLTVGAPPTIRLHGEMMQLPYPELTRDVLRTMLIGILTGDQQNRFEEKRDLDFSIEIPNLARFRCNFFVGRRGEGAVFRVIPTEIKSFSDLGLPPVLAEMARQERGLVLVTGPTGSGKSTTLAAMVDLINNERHAHILTVEDPIEFVHPHKKCIVNQREVRVHTESFASALRAALREDPDVILVGEMRDLETISLAVSAAETGHLVFGTLHTSSAAQTVDRIIDVFPPHQQSQIRTQLSESLQGVIAQTLIPKIGGGRVAALEIMTTTAAVKNLIREGKTFQLPSIIETNSNLGMTTLGQALQELVIKGLITPENAVIKGLDPALLSSLRIAAPSNMNGSSQAPGRPDSPTPSFGKLNSLDDDELGDLTPLSTPFSFQR